MAERAWLLERGGKTGHIAKAGRRSAYALSHDHTHPDGAVVCGYPAAEWVCATLDLTFEPGSIPCQACLKQVNP